MVGFARLVLCALECRSYLRVWRRRDYLLWIASKAARIVFYVNARARVLSLVAGVLALIPGKLPHGTIHTF